MVFTQQSIVAFSSSAASDTIQAINKNTMNGKNIWITAGILTGVIIVGAAVYYLFVMGDDDTATTNTNNSNTLYAVNNSNKNKNNNTNTNKNTNNSNVNTTNENTNAAANTNASANANSNTNANKNTNAAATNTNTSTAVTAPSDWKTYTNDRYKFSVKLPATWVEIEDRSTLGYYPFGEQQNGTTDTVYEGEWFVSVYNKKTNTKESLVEKMDPDASDRKVSEESVTVNGKSATKAVVTSGSRTTGTAVYIESSTHIFEIMMDGAATTDFTAFYNSFKL